MKKLLLLLLVVFASIFTLTACEQQGADDNSLANIQAAKKFVYTLYKDNASSVSTDFDVVGKAVGNGQAYDIVWTVSNDKIKIVQKENGQYTIDVPDKSTEEISFTLTATISDGKNNVSQSFDFVVPVYGYTSHANWLDLCKVGADTAINIKGYVIAVVSSESSSGKSIYLQDDEGYGYYAYSPTLTDFEFSAEAVDTATKDAELAAAFPAGTPIEVSGTGTVYNGQFEFNKGCTVARTGEEVKQLITFDATADFANAVSNEDESLVDYQNTLVKITGCTMANADGAYYYFTVGESTVKFNVYNTYYFMSTADLETLFAKWSTGNTFDVVGLVSVYSKKYQIYPLSVECISNVQTPSKSDAEAIAIVKEALTFSATEVAKTQEIEVDTTGYAGQVAIAWSTDNANVVFEDGKIKVVSMPEETTDVKVTATLTAGSESDTKEFTLKLVVDTNTLSVFDAMEIVSALEDNAWTDSMITVRGVVTSSSYNSKYQSYTIWLTDGVTEKAFELYSVVMDSSIVGDYTAADALKGLVVVCRGYAKKYVGNYVTLEIAYDSAKGSPLITSVEFPVANAMEVVNALEDNAWTENMITVSGVVTSSSYKEKYKSYTIWLTDGTTEKAFELYSVAMAPTVKGDFTAENALVGYTVVCTGYAKKYVGTSTTLEIAFDSTKGTPQITNVFAPVYTVSQAMEIVNALEDNGWTSEKITVSGVVTSSSYKSKYGSYTIWLTDGTTEKAFELYSVVAGPLFTGDFTADDALVGYTVVCTGYAKKYVGTSTTLEIAYDAEKGSPVLRSATAPSTDPEQGDPEQGDPEQGDPQTQKQPLTQTMTIDFTKQTVKGTEVSDALSLVESCASVKEAIVSAEATKVYNGSNTGGALGETAGCLKFGASKALGSLKLTFAEGTKIVKVVVNCHDFYKASESYPTTDNKIVVNGVELGTPYTEDATFADLTFEFTATNEVIITNANSGARMYVTSITIYVQNAE